MVGVPFLQQVSHILRRPRKTPLWPGLGSVPDLGLLPSCSRLANCLRILAVFSRAGDTSGLYQMGHRNSIKPSGPSLRPEPPPLATSILADAQPRKVAWPAPPRGELVRSLLHLLLWSLLLLHPSHPKPLTLRISSRETQGSRVGISYSQALCLGDPGMQTHPDSPSPAQIYATDPFPVFPADICPAASAH